MDIKKIKQTAFGFGLSLVLLTSCGQNDSASNEAEGKLENHIATVEAKVNEDAAWVKENWEDVDKNYNDMKKEVKDEELIKDMDRRWKDVTSKVESIEAKTESRYTPVVIQAYDALGISDEEASMAFVTKENIKSKYEAFVMAVDANKKMYDTNDWADIEVVWDALNKRKNEVEPIATDDNLRIAKLNPHYSSG